VLAATETVVFYVQYAAGKFEEVLPYVQFRTPKATSLPVCIGVHFRNTDKHNSIDEVLARTASAWSPGESIWLATDDASAVAVFRDRFGTDVHHCDSPMPRVVSGGIHHTSAAALAAVGTSKEQLIWDCLHDVAQLRDSKTFIDCPNSTLSKLVHALREVHHHHHQTTGSSASSMASFTADTMLTRHTGHCVPSKE
jgi:hypothetical protein